MMLEFSSAARVTEGTLSKSMQHCPAAGLGQVAPLSRFQHFGVLYYNLPPSRDSTGYEQT